MTLLDLARELDKLASPRARTRLLEQMRPLLGPDRDEFVRRLGQLIDKDYPAPAARALEQMGFIPLRAGKITGFVIGEPRRGVLEEIVIESETPGARLASLFHGAWNLMPNVDWTVGTPLPLTIRVGRESSAEVGTTYLFYARADGMARIRFIFTEQHTPQQGDRK